jgi:hypothetical protein
MTNRIGGDYNLDALEAFRAAYADKLQTPDELDVDSLTGLPTGEISNTSPWVASTGLWRYPSGKGPEPVNQPFNPNDYISGQDDDDDDIINLNDLSEEEFDEYLAGLTLEELSALEELFIDTETEEEDEEESISDEEIENLINDLISSDED